MKLCLKTGRIINLSELESVDHDVSSGWNISYRYSDRRIPITDVEYEELKRRINEDVKTNEN